MRFLLALLALPLACAPSPAVSATDRSCAGCHPTQSRAHQGSRHAHAAESDFFVALRATATPSDQGFCDSCHRTHDVEGEVGVGCVTCHQAVGNRAVQNARLVYDTEGPMRGPLSDPQAQRAHASRADAFIRSADLCGTCHEVSGPSAFVETPYSEWQTSAAARDGIQCADCHMSATPGAPSRMRQNAPAAVDGPLRALSDHSFVGPDDPRAPELLSQAAALSLRAVSRGDAGIEVGVEVFNRNPAHSLPSGARFAREVWIEVTAMDALGGLHTLSGGDDDAPDPMRIDLGDQVTRNGRPALPTASDAPRVRAIAAGGRREFVYVIPVGWGDARTVEVRARLRFRRNDRALRARLALPPLDAPPIDLARATLTL